MLYHLARRLLFHLDPERAHGLALTAASGLGLIPPLRTVAGAALSPAPAPVEVLGLRFPNRVGLAAGYDKDGDGWRGLAALGFGHIEVGTVTPRPQPGNPRPRLFRLVEDRSLVNRMGFPGRGAAYVARRLAGPRPGGLILGVNIGKQKTTPLEEAAGDYEQLIETFAPLADYLAVNVSSPNTPGLRRLQEPGFLESLLARLAARRDREAGRIGRRVPLLVKLAPDLDDAMLRSAVAAVERAGFQGIIATNTTLARDGLRSPLAAEEGGLSGAALTARSTEVIRSISGESRGRLPVVGVGGIMSSADARAKLSAGATLVQLYTGLVYEGPALVGRIARDLALEPDPGSHGSP